jgi:tetratricopeptide (TPR) repeat protein
MSGQIFISYRREDSSGSTGRLYDRLSVHFPRSQIFIDVDNLDPGIDYFEAIEESVGSCDVLIAVIGKHWLTASDAEGRRRLEKHGDLVRLEIAAALKRNIRVIPVLVDGASMPELMELPDDLQPLRRRNALEVSHARFDADLRRLIAALERVFEKVNAQPERREDSPTPTTQGDAEAAFKRGEVFYDKKEYDNAIIEYTEAVRISPKYARYYSRRATTYHSKCQYDKALSDFSEAIRLDPNDAFSFLFRGQSYFKKKQYDEAIRDITEAIRLDPNNRYGYIFRGGVYQEKQEYDNAISDFTEAIRLDPNDLFGYTDRGDVYQEKQEYDNAISDFTEAIRLSPEFSLSYQKRGKAYQSRGKLDMAKADFAKVNELLKKLAREAKN